MSSKLDIVKALEQAKKVWKRVGCTMPFATEEKYLDWVKESCKYFNSLSSKERDKYLKLKRSEIVKALENIKKNTEENAKENKN